MSEWAVGVDLGGTHLRVAAVALSGEILQELLLPTRASAGAEAVERDIVDLVLKLMEAASNPPKALGIGVAGQIDPKGGELIFAPNLQWHHEPIGQRLQVKLKLPVAILNDVRAATFGEWHFGQGMGCRDLICLFIGTGIGGGAVTGGQLLVGSNNSAGEFGHMVIERGGRRCSCGQSGCLEAYAGGWSLALQAQDAVEAGLAGSNEMVERAGGHVEGIVGRHVIEAYRAGNSLATRIVGDAREALVAGAVSLVHAFNPGRFILGGGVVEGLPEIVAWVEEGIQRDALKAARESIQVVAAGLGDKAGLIGAASYALQSAR